jgi:hypothetical protein
MERKKLGRKEQYDDSGGEIKTNEKRRKKEKM